MGTDDIAEWIGRIWWPFYHPSHILEQWADEAKKVSQKLIRKPAKTPADSFMRG